MADNSTPEIVWGPSPSSSAPAADAPQIVWGSAPSAPKPGDFSSIGAGLGRGFGESMLGIQQLLGKTLSTSIRGPVSSAGNWLQEDAAKGLTNLQQQEAPYQAAHPYLTGGGEMGGQVAAMLAPGALVGKVAPAASWLGRIGQAAQAGSVAGAEQPVSGPDYWKQKAEETAANIAGSMAGQQIPEAVQGISRFLAKYGKTAVKSHAVQKVISTIQNQEDAGYVRGQDIIDLQNTYHAAGVPSTLMETGGDLIQGLAGSVGRTPGTAQAIIKGSFRSRMLAARGALLTSIKNNFDAPHTRRETEAALTESQFLASRPLYEKSFNPSGVSSITEQFKKPFAEITKSIKDAKKEYDVLLKQFEDAKDKFRKTRDPLKSQELHNMNGAQADAQEAAKKLSRLRQNKDSILAQLRVAHQAEAKGMRGTVYSPHIAYMMEDPKIKMGLKLGLDDLATESRGKNIPFDPNDYSVKYDSNGEPEIVGTPNMRLLDAAKRGLDSIISQHRDKETGTLDSTGIATNVLRKAWVNEIDRINPNYKRARDAYAGPAALNDALFLGEKIMRTNREDVKDGSITCHHQNKSIIESAQRKRTQIMLQD